MSFLFYSKITIYLWIQSKTMKDFAVKIHCFKNKQKLICVLNIDKRKWIYLYLCKMKRRQIYAVSLANHFANATKGNSMNKWFLSLLCMVLKFKILLFAVNSTSFLFFFSYKHKYVVFIFHSTWMYHKFS